jgi:glycosyltransferase involved in cell wall biosynthesis
VDGRRPLVLHVLGDTHEAGAENQCRYLLAGLRDFPDLDVALAYFARGRGHRAFEELGVPMLEIPRRFRFDVLLRALRLRRAFGKRPPDLIHTWLPEGNVVGLLAARGWPSTRVVISQRGSWMELAYPAMLRLQRSLMGRADHAISNSQGGADMLAEFGLSRERISVIPNGIPADRVRVRRHRDEIRREMGWDGHEVVAWVGRADPIAADQKDFATLFAAADSLRESHPAFRLAMIGPTAGEIAERGFTLPVGADAMGWQGSPADLLNAADGLVISSRIEGSSNAAGEALMLGLPVATTDSGDHCDAVRAAGGRVVPVRDPQSLATAVAELLDHPPDRAAVRRSSADAMTVERMVRSHLDVYDRLLSHP